MKDEFINGPAVILNSGSISDHALTNPNNYGKYSLVYTVGMNNESFLELKRVCTDMLKQEGIEPEEIKLPWRLDEKTKMIGVRASSKNKPPIVDTDNRLVNSRSMTAGMFCKINVRPGVYRRNEVSEYLNPVTYEQVKEETVITGVMLMLNGLKLYGEEETNAMF